MLKVASDVDWRFELALIMANETGHRSKAIRHLRWLDIDLINRTIRWQAEADKAGQEYVTPLTEAAVGALQHAQEERTAIGET